MVCGAQQQLRLLHFEQVRVAQCWAAGFHQSLSSHASSSRFPTAVSNLKDFPWCIEDMSGPGLMETVCPNGGGQEWELFWAPSLKQLQRAGPLGARMCSWLGKNISDEVLRFGSFSLHWLSPKRQNGLGSRSACPLIPSACQPSSFPFSISAMKIRPYLELCKAPSHAWSHLIFSTILRSRYHSHFTDKSLKLRGYYCP